MPVITNSKFKNFIPTIWSARLLANLDKSLVFLNMVNRDYEGEISAYGDTVKINQVGDITIKKYDGTDIEDPEELSSAQQNLTIDQGHYYNFQVKDVDRAQSNVNLLDQSMQRTAYAMANLIDQDVASLVTDAGVKVGTVAAPIKVSVKNAYDYLVDLGVEFDSKNVDKAGRKIVLPPWYFGLLAKDPRFTKDMTILANGVVENATVGRFQLLESNNVKTADNKVFETMAGTTQGISFANQVVETEAYRPEKNFSDAVKGLVVYGRKVIQPDTLGNFTVQLDDAPTGTFSGFSAPIQTAAAPVTDPETKQEQEEKQGDETPKQKDDADTEREVIIAELREKGISYNGNSKTKNLQKLLDENA